MASRYQRSPAKDRPTALRPMGARLHGSEEPPGRPIASGRRGGRLGRVLASIGVIGPVFYVSLVTVLGLRWHGYDPIRDTQSELGAVGSPDGSLMNVAGFMALGVSILAIAAAYVLVLRRSRAQAVAAGLLVIAGVGMVVVGFFPCDPSCLDVSRTGRLHSLFSMPGAIGLPAAAMLSALVFRTDGRLGIGWQVTSFWLGLIGLAAGPVIAAELIEGMNGLLQRAAMWLPLAWMGAVSARLSALARSDSVGTSRRAGSESARATHDTRAARGRARMQSGSVSREKPDGNRAND